MLLDGVRPPNAARRPVAPLALRELLALTFVVSSIFSVGASRTREGPVLNAARDAADRVISNVGLSACTRAVLSRHGLLQAALVDPRAAALWLEAALASCPASEPGGPLALAELWYRAALRQTGHDPASVILPLRAAAAAAALALADPDEGCFHRAVEVHNDAVARLVRISQDDRAFGGRNWFLALAEVGVVAKGANPFVDPRRFAAVVVAEDMRVRGMRHQFRTCGLGVPVVGTRCIDRQHPSGADEQFYPRQLRIAATMVAVPGGGLGSSAYRLSPLSLILHDPFRADAVMAGGRALALAADRTAQLALQVSQVQMESQTLRGVFATEFGPEVEPGLYMLRPYAPAKIPVVFIHGLAASPVAFRQAINDFQNDPALAGRYQFWVFAYPTGATIVRSARRLREALGRAEAAYGSDPAFHRMVLVGHSLGGVLAHMAVSDSGQEVWDGALSVPPENLRASAATRATLDQLLFFRPLPYVRRVVFIATPHRGSPVANGVVGRFYGGRIRPSAEQAAVVAELEALNGPDVIKDENFRGESINAIGELQRDSTLLQAVSRLPTAPGVPFHTIAFRLIGVADNDLIVPLWSAQLDGAASEAIFPGFHGSEQSPASLGELRRILLEHLAGP